MKTVTLATLILGGLAVGCVVYHDEPRHRHAVYGPAVVVETGHVHTDGCGHFHHGGSWYYAQGHRHGAGCGHVYRGGMWVVVD